MKLPKLFKKAEEKRREALLKEYEKGKILVVDGETDNKEHFRKIEEVKDDEN